MARARIGFDDRGRLCVFATVYVRGQRHRKRVVIPENDQELAAEVLRELSRDFALGDLSFFGRKPNVTLAAQPSGKTFSSWATAWLDSYRPPAVEESTWRNYRAHVKDLSRRIGSKRLRDLDAGAVLDLRRSLEADGLRHRTIDGRLGTLRLILRDARLRGLVEASPFDTPLPRARTKRARAQSKRVSFRPLVADELEALLSVLRSPRDASQRLYFPLTEALVLTGLRWGEGAAWTWPAVSLSGSGLHIVAAIPKAGSIPLERIHDEPTKTGGIWTIPIRAPLRDLLFRQRQLSYVGRPDGWVFPTSSGTHLSYRNWLSRGWSKVLERSKVAPREGDAQKALRRTYITSALVCGRNAKQLAAEVGHTTTRMVIDTYDTWLDPARWPSDEEMRRLAGIYGWEAPAPVGGAARGTQGEKRNYSA